MTGGYYVRKRQGHCVRLQVR